MFTLIKYKIARLVDSSPTLTRFIFENLHNFKFFYPTEKDYYGLRKLIPSTSKGDFIDIGGNLGQSTISFRILGYKSNNIFIFEPNPTIQSRLSKILKKDVMTTIYPFGLSDKDEDLILYVPRFKGKNYDELASFNKKSLLLQIERQYPKYFNEFLLTEIKSSLYVLDNLKIDIRPIFIKIDVEGHEEFVLRGMENLIQKFYPVLLIEFNVTNFSTICNMLGSAYQTYVYDIHSKDLVRIESGNMNNYYYSTLHDPLRFRNVYFVPSVRRS